jgi:hypothetical protein
MLDVSDLLMQMKDNFLRIVQRYKFCGKSLFIFYSIVSGAMETKVPKFAESQIIEERSFLLLRFFCSTSWPVAQPLLSPTALAV